MGTHRKQPFWVEFVVEFSDPNGNERGGELKRLDENLCIDKKKIQYNTMINLLGVIENIVWKASGMAKQQVLRIGAGKIRVI